MSSAENHQHTVASDTSPTCKSASRTVTLPNLAYPFHPSTYVPRSFPGSASGAPGASPSVVIKRTPDARYEMPFVYASDDDSSGPAGASGVGVAATAATAAGVAVAVSGHSVFGKDGVEWLRAFCAKNASKFMSKLKKFKAKLRRHRHRLF